MTCCVCVCARAKCKRKQQGRSEGFDVFRCTLDSVTGTATIPSPPAEIGGREADAKEVRTCGHVQAIEAPAISLRRLHESSKVSTRFRLLIDIERRAPPGHYKAVCSNPFRQDERNACIGQSAERHQRADAAAQGVQPSEHVRRAANDFAIPDGGNQLQDCLAGVQHVQLRSVHCKCRNCCDCLLLGY